MKLSLLALATLLSPAAAFAPVRSTSASSSALYGITGEEARGAHTSFAPGHFETYGARGDAGRTVCDGHEIRAARASYAKPGYGEIGYDGLPRKEYTLPHSYHTSFAPGHFETLSASGSSPRAIGSSDLKPATSAPKLGGAISMANIMKESKRKKSYGLGSGGWKK